MSLDCGFSVIIDKGEVNVILATPGCGSGGGGRKPNPKKGAIVDLWSEPGLNNDDSGPGKIIAFLKRLQSMCWVFARPLITMFASSVGRNLSRVVPGTGNVRHRLVTRNLAPGPAPVA